MATLIIVSCCSLLVSFYLTPFFRDFFGFLAIVDKPDAGRKIHTRAVPRVGGIPLAVSYGIAIALMLMLHARWHSLFNLNDPTVWLVIRLMPAVAIIFLTGLVDDILNLSPWQKLLGEVLAAVYACWIGVRLSPVEFAGPAILVNIVSVFWLVFCVNAINLIDGMDGLATGVGLLASISLLMAAVVNHHPGLVIVIAPFIGGLVGFLCYNFNPATVFLGDSGSLLVGFLLGCYGLLWNQHASTGLGRAAPLVALAFPVMEVSISIARRFLRQRPIFSPDRNHIHHRMLSMGLTQRKAVIAIYGISALAGILAVLQTVLHPRLATVLLLLFLSVAYGGFRLLRYQEFSALSQFLFAGEFRRALRIKICLQEFEQALARADTIDQSWLVLKEACREAEFISVSLRIKGRVRHEQLKPSTSSCRRLEMWLSPADSVAFQLNSRLSGLAMLIAPLVERLETKLESIQNAEDSRSSTMVLESEARVAAAG